MANRREPLNLLDFSGGLNLRENQFQLAQNESPEMHNIVIDPLGGIYSRRGWERWNEANIVDPDVTTWDPRRAFLHGRSDESIAVYVASAGQVYVADNSTVFTDLGMACNAETHMIDFVGWGDDVYFARGSGLQMMRRYLSEAPTSLIAAGASTWNNDYTDPGASGAVAPRSELCEAHAGYLFVARVQEDGVVFPNRIRWSHPTSPTDWAQGDYIDIDVGGDHITALMSYEDHLVIFKSNSMWALYGYDLDSWQLVQKSTTIGANSPQAVTRNEQAVFFVSISDRGGVYVYTGERPAEISEQLRYAFSELLAPELIWCGWMDRKLWVTLPWTYDGPTMENAAALVYDPSIGERGAWAYYYSSEGSLGPLVGGSNIDTQPHSMGVLRATDNPCVVRLNARDEANDLVSAVAVLGFSNDDDPLAGFIVTDADEEIIMSGMPGEAPFRTAYRTPWLHAGWPARKKSWRRPDFICRDTGINYRFKVSSFRNYEETSARRQYHVDVRAGEATTVWGQFTWRDKDDPTASIWGEGNKQGGMIRRGSSFGLAKSLQLLIEGGTPHAPWGIDAIVLKIVMRRFR